MNKANIRDNNTDFLNISFHISNNSINLDLYNKRNSFDFFYKKLVSRFFKFTFKKIINTLINQIIRFIRVCNNDFNFKQVFKFLDNLLYNNNCPCKFLHYLKLLLKKQWQEFDSRPHSLLKNVSLCML